MEKDNAPMIGRYYVEEINPETQDIVSFECGENIICVNGATAMAEALVSGTMTTFNHMIITTENGAVARAHTSISPVTADSGALVPTRSDSTTQWTYTFPSGGSATIAKFAMATSAAGTSIWNEILFSAVKDNNTNDLKITYEVSMAP